MRVGDSGACLEKVFDRLLHHGDKYFHFSLSVSTNPEQLEKHSINTPTLDIVNMPKSLLFIAAPGVSLSRAEDVIAVYLGENIRIKEGERKVGIHHA